MGYYVAPSFDGVDASLLSGYVAPTGSGVTAMVSTVQDSGVFEYKAPSFDSADATLNSGYSPPSGSGVISTSVVLQKPLAGSTQGVFASGFSLSAVGAAAIRNQSRFVLPVGISPNTTVGEPGLRTARELINPGKLGNYSSAWLVQTYQTPNPRTYRSVLRTYGDFFHSGVPEIETYGRRVYPEAIDSHATVGSPETKNLNIGLYPIGVAPGTVGTHIVSDRGIRPAGIAPPPLTGPINGNRQVPNPWASFRDRTLADAGGVFAFAAPNNHYVAHDIQYIDQAGRSIDSSVFGATYIQPFSRVVYPVAVSVLTFGNTVVKRQVFVYPDGVESSFVSQSADVVIGTRRVYVHSGEADQAAFGGTTIFNWRQDISLHNKGWYDTQHNYPVVYNLRQLVRVQAFENNVDPTTWPRYQPKVENVDRALAAFGHRSSRFGISAWVRNAAVPVLPQGFDATRWGSGSFIAYRNREVGPQGVDSFYNERYTVVWNKADVVGPAGVGDTAVFGKPDPVINLNRTIKHHTGWVGPLMGVPFVAYRVRSVSPKVFYGIPAAMPEVRHNPHPIAPIGVPKSGQVGAHNLWIFRREAFPKPVNVHQVPWFGEPVVESRNKTLYPFGYDQGEFGRQDIQNYVRHISPDGANPPALVKPVVAFRTKKVWPTTVAAPAFTVIHRIKNDSPDPPSAQMVLLNRKKQNGEEDDGFGIPPPAWGAGPEFVLATIYPPSLVDEESAVGHHKVFSNNLLPQFIFQDQLLGTPTIVFTRFLRPTSVLTQGGVSEQARLSPWHIYAPSGDQMPYGYHPKNINAHIIDGRMARPDNNSSHPWFGDATVSNQHRTVYPYPVLGPHKTVGEHEADLRMRYVRPNGVRSLRFGQIVFLNVPQHIDFDDEYNHQGIANTQLWGTAVVAPPSVPEDPNRRVYPVGSVLTSISTTHRFELLNRKLLLSGIPHRGNPQQGLTSPWGVPLVGYPRRYDVGMGVVSLWGNNIIDFLNRPIYPAGFASCTLEDGNFENFIRPMRVERRNPAVSVPSTWDGAFGTPGVDTSIRSVFPKSMGSAQVGVASAAGQTRVHAGGWVSHVVGNIDRWEAGKLKPHGDDLSAVGTPKTTRVVRTTGVYHDLFGTHRVPRGVVAHGFPPVGFCGPSVTNPFGCNTRVVTPLPILDESSVPIPTTV